MKIKIYRKDKVTIISDLVVVALTLLIDFIIMSFPSAIIQLYSISPIASLLYVLSPVIFIVTWFITSRKLKRYNLKE